MKKQFVLKHPDIEGEVVYTFLDSALIGFDCRVETIDSKVLSNLYTHMPLNQSQLPLVTQNPLAKITEIKEDLSFETFWNKYANKIGNKPRAERLWKGLSAAEKQKALDFIPKYMSSITASGVAQLYPESYLNQKRFLN